MSRLVEQVATTLRSEAIELSARWRAQARSHAPRLSGETTEKDVETIRSVVDAIADAIVGKASWQTDLMRSSWDIGAVAHRSGVTLHYMLKEIDLLLAMVLYACERALEPVAGTPADGMRIARQVHDTASLLRLTAAKGFTHAYLSALRDRYQTLRHDLRNPLGTIKSAITLMDDESVPVEMRSDPRFRVMAVRNPVSLDTMIGTGLSDDAAHELAFSRQRISLRDIALAVRRDLRESTHAADCTIEIGEKMPTISADPIGFELVLKGVLVTLLDQIPRGSSLHIGTAEIKDRSAVISVTYDLPSDSTVELVTPVVLPSELSLQTGVRVWATGPVYLEVPGIPVQMLENQVGGPKGSNS